MSLPQLLAALAALCLTRWSGIARASTLDGAAWLCLVVDAETLAPVLDAPYGTGDTPEAAAQQLVDAIHELDAFADDCHAAYRALATAYPQGVILPPAIDDGDAVALDPMRAPAVAS